MSNESILFISVAGFVVLLLARYLFLNPVNMTRLADNMQGKNRARRILPLIASVIVAEICFAIMLVMLKGNPLYSLAITGLLLITGLLWVVVARPR